MAPIVVKMSELCVLSEKVRKRPVFVKEVKEGYVIEEQKQANCKRHCFEHWGDFYEALQVETGQIETFLECDCQ